MRELTAPYLTGRDIAAAAEDFLCKHYPGGQIPIPIEDIIDVKLGIDIAPIPGLTDVLGTSDGVEAFVHSDLTQITVDLRAYERQTNRYRFSIAHELGHIILHRDVFRSLQFDSIDGWKETVRSIPSREYAWLEWQANCFAGHVLVPRAELVSELAGCVNLVKAEGMNPADDAVRGYLEKILGDIFSVSSAVIHKRIENEGLLK